jgi:hypothetical protein
LKKNNFEITIVPALFEGYREDGNVLLRCLQDKEYVIRAFEPHIIENIENPKYILLGVMTGKNTIGLNVCDGSEFEKHYHEKWNVLLK